MIASEYDELDRELGELADGRGAPRASKGLRILPIAVGVVSVLALAGIVWYAYTSGVREGSETAAPLLRPEGQTKVAPTDRGGREIAGTELSVYDRVAGVEGADSTAVERILPPPEEPKLPPAQPTQDQSAMISETLPSGTPPMPSADSTTRDPVPAPGAATQAPAQAQAPAQPVAPPPPSEPALAAPLEAPPVAGSETTNVAATAAAPTEPAPQPAPQATVTPPPTQTAAAPATNAGDGWRIQIAALKSDADARAEWAKRQKADPALLGPLALEIQQATVNGVQYFRVRGGPLASADAAKALCAQLKAKSIACIPVAPGK